MTWEIEYFEQQNGQQPAEKFEDELAVKQKKLLGKLLRAIDAVHENGPFTGGGLIEACRDHPGLWEIRVIFSGTLARELIGFDGARVILLHGYVKRSGQPASTADLNKAATYLAEYRQTHRISPEQPDDTKGERRS